MSDGRLARLERDYPWIPWSEPIRVSTMDDSGYACRVCIAAHGLSGSDVKAFSSDPGPVREHIEEKHA